MEVPGHKHRGDPCIVCQVFNMPNPQLQPIERMTGDNCGAHETLIIKRWRREAIYEGYCFRSPGHSDKHSAIAKGNNGQLKRLNWRQ